MDAIAHSDKVLVVDDDPDTLRMVSLALEREKLTALVANSGQAAIDVLAHVIPDLILMDAVMPGIDGFETTRRIKQNPALAAVPVIFMTGLSDSDHVVRAFALGGIDYVRKPVDLAELLARVRMHMNQGRAVEASIASLDATGRLMIATDRRGNLLWCTPLAEEAIARHEPGWTRDQAALPRALRDAVERLLASTTHAGGSTRIEQPSGSLALGVVAHFRDDEVIRLVEQDPAGDAIRLRDRLKLTTREAEVLLWLSYGKANNDISEVLGISPRTAQKHLERIYEKMGVETRSAAAAVALRVIGK